MPQREEIKMGGGAVLSGWLLLTLSLTGILAGDWSVNLPSSPICAVTGSSVLLPCSFDYPTEEERPSAQVGGGRYEVQSEMWCLEDSRCVTPRYVFHSDGIFPDPSYQNRVEYLGQKGSKNCSLKISDLRPSDSRAYVFYLITSHPSQKMPEQSGVQLLVTDSFSGVTASASPSSDITDGEALRLACCSPAAGPQARYRWYKSTSTSTSMRHSGQVFDISKVTPDDSGSYYCQIQTGEKVQNSTMLHVDVEYPPRNTAMSVSPAGETQDKLPVTLTCSSDANPPVHTYSWYRGEACLPTADKSSYPARHSKPTGRSTTLGSATITAEEYGQHCCVARNKHGSQTAGVTLSSSGEVNQTDSLGSKILIIGVIIGVLLALIAIVAFIVSRRQKSSRNQSYVLTETNATPP